MGTFLFLLYNLLTPFIAAGYFAFFILSPRRGPLKKFLAELRERLSFPGKEVPEGAVWVHAASLGEVKAVKKLVRTLREKYPSVPVLITTSSGSGRAEALRLTPHARLLPLDFYPLMKGFLNRVRPRLLLIAETEIWPNMLVCAAASGTPVCIINGRISTGTLALYRALPPLTAKIFSGVRKVLAQSEPDAGGYKKLLKDASRISVTGNMKYDALDAGPDKLEAIPPLLEKLGWAGRTVWTAASTHPGEEETVLDCFLALKGTYPEIKLVIAPRHPERAGGTRAALAARNIDFLAWSERDKPAVSSPDCLLVDETGWLTGFYYLSAAAFVGGTLVDVGGHNLLEPASFSKPVLFGPYVRSTREAAEMLLRTRGGFIVRDGEELRARLAVLLKDPSFLKTSGAGARQALENLQGATAKTLAAIEPWLK